MATRLPAYAMPLAAAAFRQIDRFRHMQGSMFDLAGYGPRETPCRVLHAEPGLNLRRYGESPDHGPALLILPAPIKKSYIWDLAPEVSVIRRCLDHGLRVYLAEWTPFPDSGDQLGLEDYGGRFPYVCRRIIEADSGEARIIVAGHSLGGVLGAIFACLHPAAVRALVLLEAPLHFGADAGDFAPLVALLPDATPIADVFGQVPGSFLNLVSGLAAPHAFQWERQLDACLAASDANAFRNHMRIERWICDEFPLPGRLFTEIVELLYREDRFMQGSLTLAGRRIGPGELRAPLLHVVDPRSTVIPPQSILPFHAAAASRVKRLLHYDGDVGVAIQHVGVLAGAGAHAALWPSILGWLDDVTGGAP